MLVVLPFYSGDAWLAVKNLQWMVSLDVKAPYECVLSCDTKTDATEVTVLAKQFFKKVHQFRYDRVKEPKWPYPQNNSFMQTCWFMHNTFPKQSWLWKETDSIPLCSGWIRQIEENHVQSKKPFTGHWNSETSVFNGVAVYPWDVCRYAPKAVTAALCEGQPAWDVYCSKEVEPHLNKANHLFQHIWRDDTTGEAHIFKHAGDIDRIIRKGVVLFHRDKTGSIIDVMRHTPPCESRVEDLQKPAAMETLSSAPVVSKDRINLSEVTLWSAVWTNDEALLEKTLRVLRYCSKLANFNRIVLFSCLPVPKSKWVEWIKIPTMDIEGWNLFVNRVVPLAMHSPFSMSVHEDGFILNPHLWKPEFLKYDYIGAPWKDGVVGNGGFCIESRKLSYAKTLLPFHVEQSKTAADMWLCRNSRAALEKQGIRWAPKDLALEFSTETIGNERPSFGFHGREWSKHKFTEGWKNIKAFYESDSIKLTSCKPVRMDGRICITTTFDRNYKLAGATLFKSIRRHTDCTGIDFKVITADSEVVKELGVENCHVVTDEIKARYNNVKYSKELPKERYSSSWYRYELFSFEGYNRVICIDSDCICIEDISYLFSAELDEYDIISVEDHIVSKCFNKHVPALEQQGLNFKGLKERIKNKQIDVQTALIVANKSVVNNAWYKRLLNYANTTGFTYSVDEGIFNDFIYKDNLKIKLLPLEYDYQDLYEIHCPMLPVPSRPIIVHCQESKPFKKSKADLDTRMGKWHDRWWAECQSGKTIVAIIVWNRFENLRRWLRCWDACDHTKADLVVIHNQETDNLRYEQLCREHNIRYVPRANVGFDLGAFQDVCKERLAGFPNNWDNLIWITDDCIPMQKDFVVNYLNKLRDRYIPCYEISDECKRHIRTTGFLVTKELSCKLQFPCDPIVSREDCYAFEHKGTNMYEQIKRAGFIPKMVSTNLRDSPLWDSGCRANLKLMPAHERVFPVLKNPAPAATHKSLGLLDDLAIKYKSDKSSLYHNFATKYDELFSSIRDSVVSMLEIGVAQGQSLRMWADYFPNSIIHGADISEPSRICESYSNRIRFHLTDQRNLAQLKNLEQFSPFDIVLDDGNHFWHDQIVSFDALFPYVKQGGVYVIEDSCTSYWKEYNNNPISCVDYFKQLVDGVNLMGARSRPPNNPPSDFTDWHKGWHRREDCFDQLPAIASIHFMNALIVIHKRS